MPSTPEWPRSAFTWRPPTAGKDTAARLLSALIADSEQHGIWTLQSAIFAENEATARLHRAAGFRVVGRRERIARRDGVWRDTVLLERRSRVAG